MLRLYSKIAFFITTVEIVNNFTVIILIVSYKPKYSVKECAYQFGYSSGCDILIAISVTSIFLSVRIK
jgi:hypothetical protein